jgi:tetratricopeptide (TPR) repeat protein
VTQFYDVLQPSVARALGDIGEKRAVTALREIMRAPGVYAETVRAVGEALEKLEGKAALDPEFMVTKADKLFKGSSESRYKDILQLLDDLTPELFAKLPRQYQYYALFLQGRSYEKTGQVAKAREHYKKSLEYFDGPMDEAMSYLNLQNLPPG